MRSGNSGDGTQEELSDTLLDFVFRQQWLAPPDPCRLHRPRCLSELMNRRQLLRGSLLPKNGEVDGVRARHMYNIAEFVQPSHSLAWWC